MNVVLVVRVECLSCHYRGIVRATDVVLERARGATEAVPDKVANYACPKCGRKRIVSPRAKRRHK